MCQDSANMPQASALHPWNGQGGPGSEYTWIMRALSRANGF